MVGGTAWGSNVGGPTSLLLAILHGLQAMGRGQADVVEVLHVGLEVRLLLELLVAQITSEQFHLSLAVDPREVAAEGVFPFELLRADGAVVPDGLVLSHDVHVPATG